MNLDKNHYTISSLQNSWVKKILKLKEKSRERKMSKLFVLEGQRELKLALTAGYEFQLIIYCPEITTVSDNEFKADKILSVSLNVYQKLAHRNSTEGIMAVAKTKEHSLKELTLKSENPLILVAQAPEKPGNIGALLRTADAANIDAVIIADPLSDLYNPNIIRSSVGCVFTTQCALASSEDALAYLRENNIKIYGAALTASKNYSDCNFTDPTAIVMGTEATGLTPIWLENTDQNIIIPMQGQIDSMNVSVSAAILIFEAKRQRGFS